MDEIKSLKGFYDRYPSEWSSWKELIDIVENTCEKFGFREINTPSVERSDLYRVKSGEELMDQMYSFEDKGGREISLIPEQTPTRARMMQERKDLKKPVKWFNTSKRWRYEDVQKGRDREFFQTDVDIFGIESVEADAEIIACAAQIFKELGLEDRVNFKINDRKILQQFLEGKNVGNPEEVMKIIDDKEKMSDQEFRSELQEIGLTQKEIKQVLEVTSIKGSFEKQLERLEEIAPQELEDRISRMNELKDVLNSYDVLNMCIIDLSIVRGLAYYTGLVFEAFDTEEELRALFGGGRYDSLVGLFGSQKVPAIGFAFGYSTTVELLKKEDKWPLSKVETDVYVLSVSESVRERSLRFAQSLRQKGVIVESGLSERSFGRQLDYADSINAKRVLIVGERDLEKGEVTMKNMETGEEEQLEENKVIEHLREEGIIDQG